MLTLEPPGAAAGTRTVRLAISSTVVRLALVHVAQQAGWEACRHDGPCPCLTLADRCIPDRPATVLVVRDAPVPCREAIGAVLAGRARSVMLWNQPETLTAVFEAIRCDSTVLPNRVIALATQAPELSVRQAETIRLLAAGRSNRAIAVAVRQSLSTTKRDIAELLQTFHVPNRAALISTATTLGFTGPRPGGAADRPTAAS